jgi:peptide/nickel transport system substrate-binding protein
MNFPSSKANGRGRGGQFVRPLHNMGIRSLQDPTRMLLLLLAGLACVACSRRHAPSKKGSATARPDDGGIPAARVVRVEGHKLPEVAPVPTKAEPYGGSLHVHLESEPPHLNPLQDQLAVIDRVVGGLVYETLLECRGNQYQPGLAESWEVSPDGERITLKLRPGARWHDDRVVSGMDVQASLEPLLRGGNKSILHTLLVDVEGVDVLPDRGARLRLFRRSDLALRALCEIPILPADNLRKTGATVTPLGRQPVGTGPFKFAAWERGKRIRLVRSRPVEKPQPPFLDEIVFEIDNDGSRALVHTRRGEMDVLPRLLDILYPDQVATATLRDTLELWWLTPTRYSFIMPNHRRGPLADARFRHALSLLWDRKRFAEEIHRGLKQPIGAPSFANVPPDPFDRAQAISLLEGSGFRDTDGDGVRDVGGEAIRLSFLLPAGARNLAAELKAYALDLRRAGLLLDTVPVDAAGLQSRLERGDFDLATLTWEGQPDEDPRLFFGSQGQLSLSGFRSEALQNLVDGMVLASGPAARAPLLQSLGEWLANERPVIFLYRQEVPALVSKRVHGLAGSGERLDLRAVWVDP